jgi:hypothetical protein
MNRADRIAGLRVAPSRPLGQGTVTPIAFNLISFPEGTDHSPEPFFIIAPLSGLEGAPRRNIRCANKKAIGRVVAEIAGLPAEVEAVEHKAVEHKAVEHKPTLPWIDQVVENRRKKGKYTEDELQAYRAELADKYGITLPDDTPSEDASSDSASVTYTAAEVAAKVGRHEKTVRAWLRQEFPRSLGEKNTDWVLTSAHLNAARRRWGSNTA